VASDLAAECTLQSLTPFWPPGFSEGEVTLLRELGIEFLVDKRLPFAALLEAVDSAVPHRQS
jgi:hypothetical protein